MQKVFFIIHFNIIGCSIIFSQNIHQLKAYSDEQYTRGNFSVAIKEYQRILLFDQAHQYDDLYGKIAAIYFEMEDFDNAEIYYDFARKANRNDSLKMEFSFRKILCYFKQDHYLLGLSELYGLPDSLSSYFVAKKNLYLAICHFGLDEKDQSIHYFAQVVDSSGLDQINASMVNLEKFEKRYNPDKLEMMSVFLPGLGQTIAGDFKSGLNSILLLSGIAVYSYYTMVVYGILDGTLVLITWFYRYHTGGRRKAYDLGTKMIQEQKNLTYLQILDVVRQSGLN